MGPFGSDQSGHVDDFSRNKYNFDDFISKKSSFGRLFGEQMKIWASTYRCGHLFINAATTEPSKPPKPQTSPQGGGFTLPLPPPYRSGPLGCKLSLAGAWLL